MIRLLLVPLLAAGLLAAPASAPDDPMRNEDVVRMLVAGLVEDEILTEIRTRPPDFDVSQEMLVELKRAGVSERLLDAMRERQALADRKRARREEKPADQVPETAATNLQVRLNPNDKVGGGSIRVGAAVDPQLAALWELGNAPEDRVFAGIAVFLACRTPDHAPDRWRARSPIGQDFISMPRHRMLAFVAETAAEGAETRRNSRLKLELPERLEATVEPDVAHDLMIGLALHVGGRYYMYAQDSRRGFIIGIERSELAARVKGQSLRSLQARFLDETE